MFPPRRPGEESRGRIFADIFGSFRALRTTRPQCARTCDVGFYHAAMWSPGYLVRRVRAGLADGDPAGPAVATLHTVALRTAALIRGIAIGYLVVQVVIWRAFFTAQPARLAGPLVAAASAALVVTALRCSAQGDDPPGPPAISLCANDPPGRPGLRLPVLDSLVCVVLALTAGWCVPPALRGDTASWLYIALVVQLIVPAWFAPAWLAGLLVLASAAAFWLGVMLTGPADGTSPAAAAAFLVSVTVAVWCGYQVLYRRAARADAALTRADRESREQYVLLSRSAERREHERLLHDTVLNTLTALARLGSGPPADAVGRCWHDVTLVEHVLGAADDSSEAGRLPLGGLRVGLAAVATEMRSRGLLVHVAASPADGAEPVLPVAVSAAVRHAAREALANVLSHAGTGEAWVDLAIAAPPGGLRVTVRDTGVGFDPAQVDASRLGLRRSVIERMADCGGRAEVRSAPGAGTVVSLAWSC
jgi:signal transduction histidine kinase